MGSQAGVPGAAPCGSLPGSWGLLIRSHWLFLGPAGQWLCREAGLTWATNGKWPRWAVTQNHKVPAPNYSLAVCRQHSWTTCTGYPSGTPAHCPSPCPPSHLCQLPHTPPHSITPLPPSHAPDRPQFGSTFSWHCIILSHFLNLSS